MPSVTGAPSITPKLASQLEQLETEAAVLERYARRSRSTAELADTSIAAQHQSALGFSPRGASGLLALALWGFCNCLKVLAICAGGAGAGLAVLTLAILIIAPPDGIALLFSSVASRHDVANPHQWVRTETSMRNSSGAAPSGLKKKPDEPLKRKQSVQDFQRGGHHRRH